LLSLKATRLVFLYPCLETFSFPRVSNKRCRILGIVIGWPGGVKCSQKSDQGSAYKLWSYQIARHQSVRIIPYRQGRGVGEFALSDLPNFRWVKYYGPCQLYRECCDLIVCVYMLRGVTKQRDVEMTAIHVSLQRLYIGDGNPRIEILAVYSTSNEVL